MKIKAGRFYLNRRGEIVGPMVKRVNVYGEKSWTVAAKIGSDEPLPTFTFGGRGYFDIPEESDDDLVSEA